MADALDDRAPLNAPIVRIRTAKRVNPDPTFIPFLIHEYGLGELTPFVPNSYDLVRDGIRWQRLRGTPEAMRIGLSWLALTAAIREARPDRTFWNSFQLYLDSLPGADSPDLDRIENVAGLSVPLRSKFRRGVHGYDLPALVADQVRADAALSDTDSGIALSPGGVRWSFGRTHEVDHLYSEADGLQLGSWLPHVGENPLHWQEMTYPWSVATHPWVSSAASARRRVLAGWFVERRIFLRLSRDGETIGYRRARVARRVEIGTVGSYRVGTANLRPNPLGEFFYIEALTGFGDGAGALADAVSLLVDATTADEGRTGQLWLGPDQLAGGNEFLSTPVTVPLRKTVRERFKFLLRF